MAYTQLAIPWQVGYLRNHGVILSCSRAIKQIDRLWPLVAYSYFDFQRNPEYDLKIVQADVDRTWKISKFPFPVRGSSAVYGIGSGNWDRLAIDYEASHLFRSIKMHFVDETPWENTPLYEKSLDRIEKDQKPAWSGCRTKNQLQQRCLSIDELYQSIRENGYDKQIEPPWSKSIQHWVVPDIIRIAVSRRGEYIRCVGGLHRLGIAKILNIDTIPAVVQIEHASWDGTLEQIYRIDQQENLVKV